MTIDSVPDGPGTGGDLPVIGEPQTLPLPLIVVPRSTMTPGFGQEIGHLIQLNCRALLCALV